VGLPWRMTSLTTRHADHTEHLEGARPAQSLNNVLLSLLELMTKQVRDQSADRRLRASLTDTSLEDIQSGD
jgi:hypothetical protein